MSRMVKLSAVQLNALRWYALPHGFRAHQGENATPPIRSPKTATIEALIRHGLLERVPHPEAKGYTMVQLTSMGQDGARAANDPTFISFSVRRA